MKDFTYFLTQFMENNQDRLGDIADFIYASPPDSYFGQLGVIANVNGIDLHKADLATWKALVDTVERTSR